MTEMLEKNEEEWRLFQIEWVNSRPFSVETMEGGRCNTFDVDYDKFGQGWIHNSGTGPEDNKMKFIRGEGLGRLPKTITTLGEFVSFLDLEWGEVVYCNVCEDFIPEETGHHSCKTGAYTLECGHLWEDESCGDWTGPGTYGTEKERLAFEIIFELLYDLKDRPDLDFEQIFEELEDIKKQKIIDYWLNTVVKILEGYQIEKRPL